jgi:hypothetical protein
MRVAQLSGTNWIELSSTASGDNYNGYAETSSRIIIPAGGAHDYTLACVNIPSPRIRLVPNLPVCGTEGIPVVLSSTYSIFGEYNVYYSIDGTEQSTPLTPTSFPFTLPTLSSGGKYILTRFTFNYPAGTTRTGVVDVTPVTTYAIPTTANAGSDQSHCGATSTTLAGNAASPYSGRWSFAVPASGGTISEPDNESSSFTGTNGSTYYLLWTISNGNCTSSDAVTISFPLLAVQPSNFDLSTTPVCPGYTGVIYSVPNDATALSYIWTYDGNGASFSSTTNSVSIDFESNATSGNLSVSAQNDCGPSIPRTIVITVNPIPATGPLYREPNQ